MIYSFILKACILLGVHQFTFVIIYRLQRNYLILELKAKISASLRLITPRSIISDMSCVSPLWRYILLTNTRLGRRLLFINSKLIHEADKTFGFNSGFGLQGRDKECILVSFVRSSENPRNCTSSLLGDWHRINVALTRAKVSFSFLFCSQRKSIRDLEFV